MTKNALTVPTAPPTAANDNYSRHPDLAPLLPTLRWFYSTLALSDEPLGTGTDYESSEPMDLDIKPDPLKAEDLIAADEVGATRTAKVTKKLMQFVTVDGEDQPNVFEVPANAITHVWGQPLHLEAGRFRPSRAKAAIAARAAERLRWCGIFGAIPPKRPKELFKRRKVQPPIDWSQFAHIRARTLEGAREAAGLPPLDACAIKGFPMGPTPDLLFAGMQAGRGPRVVTDDCESRINRPEPENFEGNSAIVNRIAMQQFEKTKPESYLTLLESMTAASMGDLVASNDNKTGKRKFVRAAIDLKLFLAA